MRQAIALGQRGLGRVWPNPAVGCVIVKGGRILARGWTQPGGRPHAEAMALAACDARGATVYVSLEPCAHHGKTPPCSEALITAGVARVVTALTDPDPRVAGRGHAMLRAAGIDVVEGVEADAAHAANAGFLLRVTQNRPFVTLKLALTLDGRIATASGESRWITGPEARRMVHAMRARHDAVLVGAGTARADDPDLRVRGLGVGHQPVRVVALPQLDLDTDSRLGRTARDAPVWVLHGPQTTAERVAAWQGTGARALACPVAQGGQGLDPAAMMQALAGQGLTRVFCEGGGMLAASLLRAGLVDQMVVFSAGRLIGADGRAGLGALGLTRLEDAPRFRLMQVQPVGGDVMQVWTRAG
ncbi:bifunctional diaminohydroxyphosphoribosylaminopyrimidine deaminase/5-amino-6-(5-phosphoribosylamino)uracil reductase RibD [Roseinatronobacter alkalisoli]|uniref:Riboflavin biosynthesis protein RibD n=1 Tax=Roseinatronobacter alkalisoli TaxID=3028235 RepID=A0ABT5T8B5_9RHOB|nr:bifunctional diaminohydroxyphosphoribosylaminopyrimidine deaminase/5-amino-6-(5-phosphoribosylamino)uracil reductase RibD [Roseinatronobacter sp. HJB301]MDD7971370.1 bifunctional diaminohydroxyphosphoribosylaminopyrimidine deaminase/5-amino-6-(5-phosphoribosylamino)uracil reductase RibD [Roseinatronobacter sp. HJB301]